MAKGDGLSTTMMMGKNTLVTSYYTFNYRHTHIASNQSVHEVTRYYVGDDTPCCFGVEHLTRTRCPIREKLLFPLIPSSFRQSSRQVGGRLAISTSAQGATTGFYYRVIGHRS
jgi:hypothetical protein